jgi:N-acetylmuramoyl-L-alanine amidase
VQTLADPHRVVLELDNMRLTSELAQLPTRVEASDPYIASVRFGTRGDTLRIVFDLKSEKRTQVPSGLRPVAEFGHRVVLDLIR